MSQVPEMALLTTLGQMKSNLRRSLLGRYKDIMIAYKPETKA